MAEYVEIEGRFPDRFAGSAFRPFVVNVVGASGAPFDLTGDSATFTFQLARGGASVVDAEAHTNTPGALGQFEFQATGAQMSLPGEYYVTVRMTIDSLPEVAVYGLRILPAP